MKFATMRCFDSGVVSHEICNQEGSSTSNHHQAGPVYQQQVGGGEGRLIHTSNHHQYGGAFALQYRNSKLEGREVCGCNHAFFIRRRWQGSPADTGGRARQLMELKRSTQKAQYGGAQRWWRRVVLCEREDEGGLQVGQQAPEGLGFFRTILWRLIISVYLYFHFMLLPSFWDKIHFRFHFLWSEGEFWPVEWRMWSGPDGRNMLCKK